MLIWIDIGGIVFTIVDKYPQYVDNTVFRNTQNTLGCTIFIKKNQGKHAHGPPSPNLNPHHYRAINAPGM